MKQIYVKRISLNQYDQLRRKGYSVKLVEGGVPNTDQELVENLEALEMLRLRERSLERQGLISDLQLSIMDQIQSQLEEK